METINAAEKNFVSVCSFLDLNKGIIKDNADSNSPVQNNLISEAKRLIGDDIEGLYFSGDVPYIYFKLLTDIDKEKIIEIHRRVWNQNKVPFIFIITPLEIRIYNGYDEPVSPENLDEFDSTTRLLRKVNFISDSLDSLNEFSKVFLNSGYFWKSDIGKKIHSTERVDQKLIKNIAILRQQLFDENLDYSIIHNLIGRSIFILYLEDRQIIDKKTFYNQFLPNSNSYFKILNDKDATYQLFDCLDERLNGNLFPQICTENGCERDLVNKYHLNKIKDLFLGTDQLTGQTTLWRPYDFSIIPIELISSVYEEFLHHDNKIQDPNIGAHYTKHALVEFILNQTLPWSSHNDHEYNLRILDPACGSGIFLVESYRRLIDRWQFKNNKKIEYDDLFSILNNNLFGVDINPDAIRVASFSLCLTLMDHLDPKTIWYKIKLPDLIYTDDRKNENNLFPLNFIGKLPIEHEKFDIIIGNPPWKREGLEKNVSEYLQKNHFAQEIAQAFFWRVRDFITPAGKIALIGTSKILFNNEGPDVFFRHKLFSENYVEMIVNLSVIDKIKYKKNTRVEKKEKLFKKADWPTSVFFYQLTPPEKQKDTLIYCTPKTTYFRNFLPSLVIDTSDVKFLPRSECVKENHIWKIAMWGTQRDFDFIKNLSRYKSIEDHLKLRNDWHYGRGYQKTGNPPKEDLELGKIPLIEAKDITRYSIQKDCLKNPENSLFYRFGTKEAFFAPHILVKEGILNRKFCAMYADVDCAFRDTIFGISAKTTDKNMLKALVAYLNSSFFNYLLFLTASTWGIEKHRVYPSEMLLLPGIPFEMPKSTVDKLAKKIDEIEKIMSSKIMNINDNVETISKEIDIIFFEFLNLSNEEKLLIENIKKNSIDLFYEGEQSTAFLSVTNSEFIIYAQILCDILNNILKFQKFKVDAKIYHSDTPLNVISLNISSNSGKSNIQIIERQQDIDIALKKIDEKIQGNGISDIYFKRNLKLYEKNNLKIIKPNEKRFWSPAMALQDADEILAEGLKKRY